VIGAVVAPLVVQVQTDPDLWGHLRFGLDLLSNGTLPRIDSYSFTQDVSWVNHEWLSELFMAAAYQSAGAVGLAVLKGTLVFLIFFVVLSAYDGASALLTGTVFILLAVGTGRITLTLRPQLWSLLALAIECRWLFGGPRRWWLIAFPALFMLWVNAHGGWIVGAAILATWIVWHFLSGHSARALLSGVAVLSLLSTFVNPYGWQMWQFLAATVRMTRPVAEWQPLFTTPWLAWIPWFGVGFVVLACVFATKRPPVVFLVIAFVLAVASFRVERLSPFYVVATLIFLSPTLISRWPSRFRRFDPIARPTARLLSGVLLGVCLVFAVVTAKAASCITIGRESWVPDRVAGRALADALISGRMVTWFDWGEYAIWHLSPAIRVSLDGRRETIYSNEVLKNHDEMNAGTPQGLAYLQSLHPDYVWLPASRTKVRSWLTTHGYRIDVDTPRSFVAVRASLPVVRVTAGPLPACFPGP
jgi:hypothetical protein